MKRTRMHLKPSLKFQRAVFVLFLLSFCLLQGSNLHAHATLLHSQPSPSSRLDRAPQQIELSFNERIESVFHSLRVVTVQGREIETGEAGVADGGETLIIALPPLPTGPYAVYWRVNSLDGHQVTGHFGFGVNDTPPSDAEVIAWQPVASQQIPAWYFPALKGLSLLALAIWFGALGVAIFCRSAGGDDEAEQAVYRKFIDAVRKIAPLAGAGYLLLELAALVGKTAVFMGTSLPSALLPKFLQATLAGSSYGQWWSIRFVAGLALVVASKIVWRRRQPGLAGLGICGLLAAVIVSSIAVTGHAQSAGSNTILAAAMAGIHLAASLMWAGSLFFLGLGVGIASEPARDARVAVRWLSAVTPRFSRLAQVCVALIIATGIYNTWLHVPGWSAFLATGYGRTLLGKLAWVLLTLAIAFINWRRVLPELARLRQGSSENQTWVPRFQPLLQSEFAGCIIIFAIVAMLTNMAPASADPYAGARELSKKSESQEVFLRIDPARLGANSAQIQVKDSAGRQVTDVRKVMVYLRSRDMDMGLTTVAAQPRPGGDFVGNLIFSMAGRWQVSVEITPGQGDAFVVDFEVTI